MARESAPGSPVRDLVRARSRASARDRGLVAFGLLLAATSAGAQGPVIISSVDNQTVPSFGTLTITGSGFDPAHTAISVNVVPQGRGLRVTVPAFFATATSIKIVMPAPLNGETNAPFDTPIVADLQVVQVAASSVTTSNVFGGLTINPLPVSPVPTGVFTKAFLTANLGVQRDVEERAGTSPALSGMLNESRVFQATQLPLIDAVAFVSKHPDATVAIETANGQPFVISTQALVISDRLLLGFMNQYLAQFPATSAGRAASTAPQAVPCDIDAGDPQLTAGLCIMRAEPKNAWVNVAPGLLQKGAQFLYGAMLSAYTGFASAGLVAAEVITEVGATAFSVASSVIGSYTSAHAVGDAPPKLPETMTDVGATIVDAFAKYGFGITGAAVSTTRLVSQAEQLARGDPPADAPQKGLVINGPATGAPPHTRAVFAFQGFGAAATAVRLAVPDSPQFVPFTTATLPPLAVARFNGLYSGAAGGSCTVTGPDGSETASASAPITATVSNGTISFTGGASGTGSVSETGLVNSGAAAAAGAICNWGGRFWDDPTGRAGGLGSWTCTAPNTTCAGTWNLLRSP